MYVITGGAGFIGSALVWQLNKRGIEDIIIVDNLASTEKWRNLTPLKYIDYIHKDNFIYHVRQSGLPAGVKAVIHLGACSATTELNADYLMENNFHYTRDLCKATLAENARFINASSAATYGGGEHGFSDTIESIPSLRPLNMYGYSKQLFDLWSMKEKLIDQIVSLKFFNVYGPNEYHKGNMMSVACKAVPQIQKERCLKLFKSHNPTYRDGAQMRDFVYIKDVVALIDWLIQTPSVNGIYNVGQGKARTWKDLAVAVFHAMNITQNIQYIEMPEELRGKYQYFTEADMSWLEAKKCPLAFHTLEEGISDYVKGYLMKENKYLDL